MFDKMLIPPLWAIVASYIDDVEAPMLADLPCFAAALASRSTMSRAFMGLGFLDAVEKHEYIHVLIWYWNTRHRRVGYGWHWDRIATQMCGGGNVRGLQWALSVGAKINRRDCRIAAAECGSVPLLKLLGVDRKFFASNSVDDYHRHDVVWGAMVRAHIPAMRYIKAQGGLGVILLHYNLVSILLPTATLIWIQTEANV